MGLSSEDESFLSATLLINDSIPDSSGDRENEREVDDEQPYSEVDEPPYSLTNEFGYFFRRGVPIGMAAMLEWGVPPMVAMSMAGHTPDSPTLQASLGFGRVFFNITMLMPMLGSCEYIASVIPGCVGAKRMDRIPMYLKRSVALTCFMLIPVTVLQFFSSYILMAVNVPADVATDVRIYCLLMIPVAFLMMVDVHIETLFFNLGHGPSAMVNSLLCGLGVDVCATYFFVYQWDMGMRGAAYSQIIAKSSRFVVWAGLIAFHGLGETIFGSRRILIEIASASLNGTQPPTLDPLFSWQESRVFLAQALPSIARNFSGWFIFELQIMLLANIRGISADALAAGAIWVQCESTLAAVQNGWIQVTSMRTIKLLGRADPGAPKSFMILSLLAALVVAATNIPLLVYSDSLSKLISNDPEVAAWFRDIVWVLALHSQTRISSINAQSLFIPMGKGLLSVFVTSVSFYVVAAPIASVGALTDLITSSIKVKMILCVGCTSIAQTLIVFLGFTYLALLDWKQVAHIITDRANTDKQMQATRTDSTGNHVSLLGTEDPYKLLEATASTARTSVANCSFSAFESDTLEAELL
eukprot:gb/GEZN01004949.1/.p1 GENE.gb/GEZN01004949.1/~~gb/GEZN01004949.1/.p1  ORF type:complete len:584 (-),score=60.52 gb/GEZN01004949.1/:76-1827(-)